MSGEKKRTGKKSKKDSVEEISQKENINIQEIKEPEKVELKVFKTLKLKLEIAKTLFCSVPQETKQIVVENLGAGDVYINNESGKRLIDISSLLKPLSSRTIDSVEQLYLISYSRPDVVIKFLK